MGCRIGMATDVIERIKKLKAERKVPPDAKHQVLKSNLTYKQASILEDSKRDQCGPHCQGHVGGLYKAGKVWSVYRLDW